MPRPNRGRPATAVEISKSVTTAVPASPRVMTAAAMFGLGVDESHRLEIVPRSRIALPAGGVVFITGPSGGGKSTVLHLIMHACAHRRRPVIAVDDQPLPPDLPLVDALCADEDFDRCVSLLALVGLADAFVMLRRPAELSDGQRCRLRIAQAIDAAARHSSAVIVIDEFGATLDRITARNIARSLRRWVSSTRHTFVCATTHDDLLEPLQPDVLVYKGLGGEMEVIER